MRSFSCSFVSFAANTRSTARWTFSKQVSHGSSEWFWNTTARSGPGAAISRSSQSSTPLVGRVSPAIRLSSVDLPQPEWPISVTNSPLLDLQVDLAQGMEAPLAAREHHLDVLHFDEAVHGGSGQASS